MSTETPRTVEDERPGLNTDSDPRSVAAAFLAALEAEDVEAAMAVVAEDVIYANQGLPVIRGHRAVRRVLGLLDHRAVGFQTCIHAIAVDGPVVLTERTDIHRFGPLAIQFWVCGRYNVRDGRLTLLREYFDFADIARGTARGLLALVIPGLAPSPPGPGTGAGRTR